MRYSVAKETQVNMGCSTFWPAHTILVCVAYAQKAGCFALFAFLESRDCCLALPHDATGLSAVCDCGIP